MIVYYINSNYLNKERKKKLIFLFQLENYAYKKNIRLINLKRKSFSFKQFPKLAFQQP